MLNLNPNPCPICGGEIKLYSHVGDNPDTQAECQGCKAVFPFHVDVNYSAIE